MTRVRAACSTALLTLTTLALIPGSPAGAATSKPKKTNTAKASTPKAVDPNAPEVVAPGDIPDNQVFVAYQPAAGGYTIKVPEGWARTETTNAVSFTDKYNSIQVTTAAASPPTVDSVKNSGLADVAKDPSFKLGTVSGVKAAGGSAIRATFEIGSTPNKVTGKKALLAVERYVYFANGHQVVVTLSGAKGADNVDPWKVVSDSVRVK
jgi:hypothetical protein